jgi:hypothetical protein
MKKRARSEREINGFDFTKIITGNLTNQCKIQSKERGKIDEKCTIRS